MAYDFGTIDMDYAGHLATISAEDDGPIFMVNFMRYKKKADYGDGSDPGISGKEADDRYAPVDVLARIGAHVAYFGDVADPPAAGAERWDRMAIVRYPTRRSFIEMQARPDFKEKVVHKDAGMEFTIVMGALPTDEVAGEPEGSQEVAFLAYPSGASVPEPTSGALFEVEGVVIGDERRFDRLVVTWSGIDESTLPEGVVMVRTRPQIDELRRLVVDSLNR